jgi:hypothetical protein
MGFPKWSPREVSQWGFPKGVRHGVIKGGPTTGGHPGEVPQGGQTI